jgi:type IV pilus assembly protein PilF
MRMGVLVALAALSWSTGCAFGGPGPEDVKISQAEYGLANDAFQRGQYRQALDHVEKAIDRDDANADAAYLGGMIMLVFCAQDETSPDCRYERAEHYLRAALAADPEMRDAKNALGVVLVHQGRQGEAIEVLEPLSKDMLYRSPEKAWGNLGWALLEADRIDEAIPALKRAVAAQPLFCVGHYRLGLAYEKKGEFAAARQAFTRAVSTEGGQCERLQAAFWGRARVESKLGRQAAVRKDLEKCRDIAAITPIGKKCSAGLGKEN